MCVFLFIIILVETRKLRVSSKNRIAEKPCLFYPAQAGWDVRPVKVL